jgi:transposase
VLKVNGMHRGELTDEQWATLAPLLPARARTGRPPKSHRRMLNGMLWILRTGAPWRDLPARYGKWNSVAKRFYRWRAAGVLERVALALERAGDLAGRLDWDRHFVDASIVRAHQHAAGAKGGTLKRRGLGTAAAA